MGSLKLDNLRNAGKTESGYTYIDLHLDIEEVLVPTKFTKNKLQGKDIRVDYDVDAIINSLNNIFKTIPGERFLVPNFGCNLERYLFSSVSEAIANRIGSEIVRAIELWEPRVTVDIVQVIGRPEQHEYDVTIRLTINAIKKKIELGTMLNKDVPLMIRNLNRVCPTA